MKLKRSAGILLHPTSLPGEFGIGNIGKSAFDFIDFLADAKQKIWQILPLNFPGYGDSPYNPISAFANNPYLIDPTKLIDMNLITNHHLNVTEEFDDNIVEFSRIGKLKLRILKLAFNSFRKNNQSELSNQFDLFCEKNRSWLDDFALFASIRAFYHGKAWNKWEKGIRNRKPKSIKLWEEKLASQIQFQKFLQYIFAKQWDELQLYAHKKNVEIVGDIPIYVAFDSADVWANQESFMLDKEGNPIVVAGVPPDYFSPTGQLWGNPIYDWKRMQQDGFKWWQNRISHLLRQVDFVRIDHFIGFVRNWQVAFGSKTAEHGNWLPVPGNELLSILQHNLVELPIIAEDLGSLTQKVTDLRDKFELPGMLPLQFAFGENYSPMAELPQNKIVYTATHDNDTTSGWFKSLKFTEPKIYRRVVEVLNSDSESISWDFIELAYSSPCLWAITTVQDILSLGSQARMNTPGTIKGNWNWRFTSGALTDEIASQLAKLSSEYNRAE